MYTCVCVARRVVSCFSTGVLRADRRERAAILGSTKNRTVRCQVEFQTKPRATATTLPKQNEAAARMSVGGCARVCVRVYCVSEEGW